MSQPSIRPEELVVVEESTENHWVGAVGRVLVTILFEGSYDDPSHVHAGIRLARRLTLRNEGLLRLLSVLPPGHGRPPSPEVRAAISDAVNVVGRRFERLALVLPGTGFLGAIHRGAATGIMAMSRSSLPYRVTSTLSEGAAFAMAGEPNHRALAAFCADRLARKEPTPTSLIG